MNKSNEYSCARSTDADCLRPFIKLMAHIFLNNLKNIVVELADEQID